MLYVKDIYCGDRHSSPFPKNLPDIFPLIERYWSAPVPAQVEAMEHEADAQRDRQRAATVIEGKRATHDFDVFLCYHGQDKQAVKQMGEQLQQHGILPWLDEWELRPGLPWQQALEEQIDTIMTACFLVKGWSMKNIPALVFFMDLRR
jgi:hypothetical protein